MAPDLTQLRQWISVLTVPVYFYVAWTFYRRNLWRQYQFFWLCLLVEGTGVAATLLAGGSRKASILTYLVVQPPTFSLYILMVLEVFQKVFARFPGIAKFAKRVVLISLAVAFVFALASIGGEVGSGWTGQSLVSRYSVILRAISSALTIYMILIAAFLLWLPVPLPANTIRHSYLFFFYFIVTAGVHYTLNLNRSEYVAAANLITSILTLAALVAWNILVRPEGEAIPSGRGERPQTSAGDMLGRLEAINRSLSRPQL